MRNQKADPNGVPAADLKDGAPHPSDRASGFPADTLTPRKAIILEIDALGLPTRPVTDQDIIRRLYSGAEFIGTDKAMNKSKGSYPLPWLIREIVQNFVDANPGDNYGTLDGVSIATEAIPGGEGMTRITIRGNWQFEDVTGLTALHSDKVDDPSAGGNGIGLKQTALRLFEDFSMQRFAVEGEKWLVDYRLVKAAIINAQNDRDGQKVRHNWLLADIQASANSGQCAYVFETDDKQVIQAFEDFYNIGVSSSNDYLKKPVAENAHGALCITPNHEDFGRLYLNGQVMHFGKIHEDDYFAGPQGISIRLNKVDYKISVDRPPISIDDFHKYSAQFLINLTEEQSIHILSESKHYWTDMPLHHGNSVSGWSRPSFPLLAILKIVAGKFSGYNRSYTPFTLERFKKVFEDAQYALWDAYFTEEDLLELKAKGYVLVPKFLSHFGIEGGKQHLESSKAAEREQRHLAEIRRLKKERELARARGERALPEVDASSYAKHMELQAATMGAVVPCLDLSSCYEEETFAKTLIALLRQHFQWINFKLVNSESDSCALYQLEFNEWDHKAYSQFYPPQMNDAQKQMHVIRGIAAHGLLRKHIEDIHISDGERVVTFAPLEGNPGAVAVKVQRLKSPVGLFIDFGEHTSMAASVKSVLENPLRNAATIAQTMSSQGMQVHTTNGRYWGSLEDALSQVGENVVGLQQRLLAQFALGGGMVSGGDEVGGIGGGMYGQEAGVAGHTPLHINADFLVTTGEGTEQPSVDGIRSLQELFKAYEAAPVMPKSSAAPGTPMGQLQGIRESLAQTVSSIDSAISPFDHHIEDFAQLEPTPKQVNMLQLLKSLYELTTCTRLNTPMFVYDGKGAKGVNINNGEAIGIHHVLFGAPLKEALGSYCHETVHNVLCGHDDQFAAVVEGVFMEMWDAIMQVINRLSLSEELSDTESQIIFLYKEWERLRNS